MSETTWRDRVNVMHVEQSVSSMAVMQYRDKGYEDAIRSQAARVLAEKLIREGAAEHSVKEPAEDDYTARTTYKWDVAVVMPEGGRSHFAEQLAEAAALARKEALLEAAEFVRKRAVAMREVNGLIAFNIDAVASDLRAYSAHPLTPKDTETAAET